MFVDAKMITLIFISEGLVLSIERMRSMSEEMEGRGIYFPPESELSV